MQGVRARSELEGTQFGDVRWVPETGSTNADVLELAREGAPEGLVLVADHQRAGRGRLDRDWFAPPEASLLVSVLLRPDMPARDAWVLTAVVALAIAEACDDVSGPNGPQIALKWPNDVVVVDESGEIQGKLGGILAESVVTGSSLDAVVVGFGLNVNWPVPGPAELEGIAVALSQFVGGPTDREDLLIVILCNLERWFGALSSDAGWADVLDAVRHRSATIGHRVRVELATGSFEGTATAITDDGELLVVVPGEAAPRVVNVGDVIHLRRT